MLENITDLEFKVSGVDLISFLAIVVRFCVASLISFCRFIIVVPL